MQKIKYIWSSKGDLGINLLDCRSFHDIFDIFEKFKW